MSGASLDLRLHGAFADEELVALARALFDVLSPEHGLDLGREVGRGDDGAALLGGAASGLAVHDVEAFDECQGMPRLAASRLEIAARGLPAGASLRLEQDRSSSVLTIHMDADETRLPHCRAIALKALVSKDPVEAEALAAMQATYGLHELAWPTEHTHVDPELVEPDTPEPCRVALECVERFLASKPDVVGARFVVAVMHARLGETHEALRVLDECAARAPGFVPVHLARAYLRARLGEWAGALAALDAVPAWAHGNHYHRARFEALFRMAQWSEALACLASWEKLGAGVEGFPVLEDEARLLRARLLSELGDGDAARRALDYAETRAHAERVATGIDSWSRARWLARFVTADWLRGLDRDGTGRRARRARANAR